MKAAFFSLFALAASAIASPVKPVGAVVGRDITSQITLTTLTETIKGYTSSINVTVEAIAENPTVEEQTSAVEEITPALEGITDALYNATKAATSSDFWEGDSSDVVEAVESLVYEIVYTVNAVVVKIGLVDGLLTALQPLIVSLGGLVRSLVSVVGGLLSTVQTILETELSSVLSTTGLSSLL